jgi:DAACS family dicarboxylate/amino acid:cation (Na+ or H+) symporter
MAVSLAIGLVLGLVASASQSAPLFALARAMRPFGTLFLNLLSMVVIPLVVAALFTGVANLGDMRHVGRLGARALGFFWITALIAIVIGFLVASALLPLGQVAGQQSILRDLAAQDSSFVQRAAQALPSGAAFIVDLVPRNPVRAAVDGALLPLVVFTTLAGIATAQLPADKRAPLVELADAATQALIRIVYWVLLLAPLGVFALVYGAVAQFGWALVRAIAVFVLAVITGLAVFIAIVYLPIVAVARLRPVPFLQAGLPSLAMAFSTTSSLAALPLMLQATEDAYKVPRTVAGFVLPLGASLNRAGSALFQAVAVLFVSGLFGVPLGPAQYAQAGVAVFLASLTVAPVPSSSVVSLAPAFAQTGLPLAGLGLLIGLDRIPDMFRTMTNVMGDLAAAVWVAAREARRR